MMKVPFDATRRVEIRVPKDLMSLVIHTSTSDFAKAVGQMPSSEQSLVQAPTELARKLRQLDTLAYTF